MQRYHAAFGAANLTECARAARFFMKDIQKILSRVRYAVQKYDMIEEGDCIAVGVSGGKDSLTLLCALCELAKFYPNHFTVIAVMIDMGFDLTSAAPPPMDTGAIEELCRRLGIPFYVKRTQIAHVIFDVRREKNPCSLCARMRRGVLHDAVLEFGANKLALGHHFDDAAETLMLNLFFEGRFGAFSPVTYLSKKGLTMIRPLIYTKESDIKSFVRRASLPVIKSPCPADGNTERALMKTYLGNFDHRHRGLYKRLVGALERSGIDGWSE